MRSFLALISVTAITLLCTPLVSYALGPTVPLVNTFALRSAPISIIENYQPCEDSEIPCSEYPNIPHPDPANPNYEIKLEGTYPKAYQNQVFILDCVNLSEGTVCSSGNPQSDALVTSTTGFNFPTTTSPDFSMAIGPSNTDSVAPFGNPLTTNPDGKISVIVRGYTKISTTHSFLVVYREQVAVKPTREPVTTNLQSQNQLDIKPPPSVTPTFTPAPTVPRNRPPTQPPTSNVAEPTTKPGQPTKPPQAQTQQPASTPGTKCNGGICGNFNPNCKEAWCMSLQNIVTTQSFNNINHDPKGRVFDATSFEPISDVIVSLIDKTTSQLFKKADVTNPLATSKTGEFYFYVPSGIYELQLPNLKQGTSWPLPADQAAQVAASDTIRNKKAYFCDNTVLDQSGKSAELYTDVFPIPVTNKIIHCDIPVLNTTPVVRKVETITYGVQLVGNVFHYSGRVSHPFTKIIGSTKSKEDIFTIEANNLGYWSFDIPVEVYPTTYNVPDTIEISYEKYGYTANTDVSRQKSEIMYAPIVQYISGKISPDTDIYAKVKNSTTLIKIATTDKNGSFTSYGVNLPTYEYSIITVDTKNNTKQSYTTTEFISQATKTVKTSDIKFFENDTPQLEAPKTIQEAELASYDAPSVKTTVIPQSTNSKFPLQVILGLIGVLIILGGAGLALFIRMRNRQVNP